MWPKEKKSTFAAVGFFAAVDYREAAFKMDTRSWFCFTGIFLQARWARLRGALFCCEQGFSSSVCMACHTFFSGDQTIQVLMIKIQSLFERNCIHIVNSPGFEQRCISCQKRKAVGNLKGTGMGRGAHSSADDTLQNSHILLDFRK